MARDSKTIQERFEEFDERHPEVFDMFVHFCREAKRRGRRHFGAKMIMERIRWYYTIEQDAKEPFKINNNYTSRYVRKLQHLHPDLADLFDTRQLQSA